MKKKMFGISVVIQMVLAIVLYALEYVSVYNMLTMLILILVNVIILIARKKYAVENLILFFNNIAFTFCLLNSFVGFENILDVNKEIILDVILYFFLYFLFYGIFGRTKHSIICGNVFAGIYLIGNVFLQEARGRKLSFFDLKSMGTALNVAEQYKIEMSLELLLALILFILFSITVIMLCEQDKISHYKSVRVGSVLSAVLCYALFIYTSILRSIGIYDRAWDYDEESLVLNFIVEYRETCSAESDMSKVPCPDGYSEQAAIEILKRYDIEKTSEQKTEMPDVIVVMNESWADLRIYGSLGELDDKIMPFYDSLKENVTKGTAYSSIFGGNTANAEYEFLSADSMILYPKDSVVYSWYFKNYTKIPTILQNYKKSGYTTIAMHPYRETGWYRDKIYPVMGFEKSYWEFDFPQEDIIRRYISDKENYAKLIEEYEKQENDNIFIFNVTMQNHGGYSDRIWTGDIQITESMQEFEAYNKEELELYLSLVKESDKALQELIEYFSNCEKPVVLLMFGDHQPSIEYVNKKKNEYSDMTQYAVPFFVWTNYEMDSEYIDRISMNYLPVLLADKVGMEENAYFRFLKDLYSKYPVITANGVMDSEGNEIHSENLQNDLKEYEYVMYYRLTGEGEEYKELFGY